MSKPIDNTFWKEYWARKKAQNEQVVGVVLRTKGRRLQVIAPKNDRFNLWALAAGGRWKKRSAMWSFMRHQYPEVAAKCNEIFHTKYGVKRGVNAIN